jgi:hypothetical protein
MATCSYTLGGGAVTKSKQKTIRSFADFEKRYLPATHQRRKAETDLNDPHAVGAHLASMILSETGHKESSKGA